MTRKYYSNTGRYKGRSESKGNTTRFFTDTGKYKGRSETRGNVTRNYSTTGKYQGRSESRGQDRKYYSETGKYQGRSSGSSDGSRKYYTDTGRYKGSSKKSGGGCFLTSACAEARGLPDDCLELTTLRTFRDSYLGQQPDGPAAIAHYYEVAPAIVERINVQPNAKEVYGQLFNELVVPCVELIQEGKLSEALTTYASAVMRLEREYL